MHASAQHLLVPWHLRFSNLDLDRQTFCSKRICIDASTHVDIHPRRHAWPLSFMRDSSASEPDGYYVSKCLFQGSSRSLYIAAHRRAWWWLDGCQSQLHSQQLQESTGSCCAPDQHRHIKRQPGAHLTQATQACQALTSRQTPACMQLVSNVSETGAAYAALFKQQSEVPVRQKHQRLAKHRHETCTSSWQIGCTAGLVPAGCLCIEAEPS